MHSMASDLPFMLPFVEWTASCPPDLFLNLLMISMKWSGSLYVSDIFGNYRVFNLNVYRTASWLIFLKLSQTLTICNASHREALKYFPNNTDMCFTLNLLTLSHLESPHHFHGVSFHHPQDRFFYFSSEHFLIPLGWQPGFLFTGMSQQVVMASGCWQS